MKNRLRAYLPLAGAILLALLPFREFLGSGVPSGRDLLFYFFPLKAHLVEAVTRGEMPWVDRFRWGGSPLLGAPSAAPFDPANVLFVLLPLGTAMKAWILLHFAVALAGFAAFARRLGLERAPAAVAGLVFTLGGTTVSLAAFPAALSALSVLPWFAASVFDLRRAPGRRAMLKIVVTAALVLFATPPEFVFYAVCVAVAVFFSAPRSEGGRWRGEVRALILLAASALLAAGLGAISILPGAATAMRSTRVPGGGMSPQAAASQPLASPRIGEILLDGLVADWTVAAKAPGVPVYPYLPSLTPGRVAWVLVLAGLLRKGAGRIAAAALALFGTLLALGNATPVFGVVEGALPPLGWIRYPEKHMILAGFGLAWLAALGLSRLALAVSPRAWRIILPLLAVAVFLDREEITRRLSPVEEAAVLTKRPPLLAALPEASGDAPPPRLFFNDLYQPAPIYDRDIVTASRVGCMSLLPAYASLFGVGYQFEVDYDLSLSAEAFEWTHLLSRAVPKTPALALRFVRGAGVSAIVKSELEKDGRYRPHLAQIGNSLPPYRFAARVVASADARSVFARLLEEGFSADTAYVDAALPGVPASPGEGRILSVSDRPSGLFLDVEVDGPAQGFLMLYRLREAAEEATLDGRPVPVSQVAFGFAGLPVPPGRHALRLRPDTRWVKIGALITVLTALALAASLLAPRRRTASGSA